MMLENLIIHHISNLRVDKKQKNSQCIDNALVYRKSCISIIKTLVVLTMKRNDISICAGGCQFIEPRGS